MLRESVVSDPETAPNWYADGLPFACTRCGNCCSGAPGYVWVDAHEREQIANALGLAAEEFIRRHVRRVGRGFSLLERPGGDCEFLVRSQDGTTGCQIHAVRPTQCRTWPFWRSNLTTPVAWRRVARGCPGIGRGSAHGAAEIEAAIKANGSRPL